MNSVFLPKDDQELPDNYSIIVEFHSGKVKEIEVASHRLIELVKVPDPSGPFVDKENRHYRLEPSSAPFIEYVTKDDLIGNLPVASYQSIVFDKRYSKIIEINRKLSEKKEVKEK
jgi:hypothetical protein